MLYMMGSGVHIMNIIFTVYQLIGPLKAMFSMNACNEQPPVPNLTSKPPSPQALPSTAATNCIPNIAPVLTQGGLTMFAAFKPVAEAAKDLGVDLTLHKLVFIACQMGVLLFITHRFAPAHPFSTTGSLSNMLVAFLIPLYPLQHPSTPADSYRHLKVLVNSRL